MKKFIAALILITFSIIMFAMLSGCATRQQRAQKLLKRAISLDASIIKDQRTDTTIKVGIQVDTQKIKPATSTLINFNCDSLKAALEALNKRQPNNSGIKLYTDSAKTISVLSKNGKLYAKFDTPADTLKINKTFYVNKTITVKGKLITEYQDRPVWHYFWFWFMGAGILALMYFLFQPKIQLKK